MRGTPHPGRECPTHGETLVETTSGDQLVCPTQDCRYYERTDQPSVKRKGKRR